MNALLSTDDDSYDSSEYSDTGDALGGLLDRLVRPAQHAVPSIGEAIGPDDRYTLHTRLGRGGQGIVFQAQDTKLNRPVAVKFILADPHEDPNVWAHRCASFDEEIFLLGQLQHENIVAIYDRGLWNNVPFLVMEHLQGQTLRTLLRHNHLLKPTRALHIILQVAQALKSAHQASIIHRDLKPENIFLLPNQRVRILDFGLAWLKPSPEAILAGATVTNRIDGGTARYMAPEQWHHDDQDERTDLWALGVILYEMLTGDHPYPHEHSNELRSLTTQPPTLSLPRHLPLQDHQRTTLLHALQDLLQPSPNNRTPYAAQLLDQLQTLDSSTPSLTLPAASTPKPTPAPFQAATVHDEPAQTAHTPPSSKLPLFIACTLLLLGVLGALSLHTETHTNPVIFNKRIAFYSLKTTPKTQPTCPLRSDTTALCIFGNHTFGTHPISQIHSPLRIFILNAEPPTTSKTTTPQTTQ